MDILSRVDPSRSIDLSHDVLPVFVVRTSNPSELLGYKGTAFLMGDNLLITCWHCVSADLPDGQRLAVLKIRDPEPQSGAVARQVATDVYYLSDVSRDLNGYDLASARVDLKPKVRFCLAATMVKGTDVLTTLYPFVEAPAGEHALFLLRHHPFDGYVTARTLYDHPGFKRTPSYEVAMPASWGLGGAPPLRVESAWPSAYDAEVVGVIYGVGVYETIEQPAGLDQALKRQVTQFERVQSPALAHPAETLRNLRGKATNGRPLGELLYEQDRIT